MRKMTKTLLLALLIATTPNLLAAEAPPKSPTSEDLARRMIEATGGADMAKQVMQEMISMFKQQNPSVPAEFWDEFMASVDTKALVELTVPIYVRHLTAEEMTAAIEFYNSPAGKSLTRKLPAIVQESMSVGQSWGEDLARDIIERVAKYKQAKPEA